MSKKSQALDKLRSTSKVVRGESIRFRDSKGKLTKFNHRKKLIAEIWRTDKAGKKSITKKTNRVLNQVKGGRPIPQKFKARTVKRKKLFLKNAKQGPRHSAVEKKISTKFDARLSIEDNIENKCDPMLSDIAKFTKRKNAALITTEFNFYSPEIGETKYEVVRLIIKGSKQTSIKEIAASIIARLYRNKLRMSNIKISPMGKRAQYVRSIPISFRWVESKRL